MLLTEQEVADKLKISRKLVMDLARKKRLPAMKVGRFWRFDEERLNTLIDNKTRFFV